MQRRTWAILLAYDGSPFKGFQPHPRLPTVGGLLAACLRRQGVGATPIGASRTDAGVHARAQAVSFTSRADLVPADLLTGLRRLLPSAVRVLAVREADRTFHAHWSSVGKIYRYRVSLASEPMSWRLPSQRLPFASLNRSALEEALERIRLAPDVSGACSGEDPRPRAIGRAQLIRCDARGALIELQAAGFGKHLVRHLVGGAVGATVGALTMERFQAVLDGRIRPPIRGDADGLCLHQVVYPPSLDPFPDLDALAGAGLT